MPSLLRQLGKNIISGWASLSVRMILVFLVNPFIIHSLGNHLYGVWILIFSIINYMTILDLGLQQALVRYVSKFLGLGDYDKINSILNSSFVIYSAVGVVVILISIVLSFFALNWFNVPLENLADGRAAIMIIGLNTACNFIFLPWGGSLGAFHRFDIANGIAMAEDICRTIVIVVLLKNGFEIVALSLAYLVFTLLRLATAAFYLKKLHPPLKLGRRYIEKGGFHLLFDYGYVSFLISIAWLLIANSDNVVIGYFLDTAAVTIYAIAAGLLVALRNLVLAVAFPLRPLVSHYDALEDRENIKLIYTHGTRYLYFLTFSVAGLTLVFADSFITLWMGPGYSQSADILKILILPAAIYLPQAVGNAILYGIERHRNILIAVLMEGALNLTLSIMLIRKYGLVGVAYGTVIAQLIVYLVIMPLVIRRALNIDIVRFYRSTVLTAAAAFGLSFVTSKLLSAFRFPDSWLYLAGEMAVVTGINIVIGLMLIDKKDMMVVRQKLWGQKLETDNT